MCHRVQCEKCGKVSWQGCGAHVEQVLAGVPEDKRCKCERPQPKGFWGMLLGGLVVESGG